MVLFISCRLKGTISKSLEEYLIEIGKRSSIKHLTMAASSTTINFSSTSLPGHTGATTPSTFTDTMNTAATVVAILTAGHTTITAYQVESTTGLAVVDGTTLTWRHEGITLSNGVVVSLGFNGLEDSTTTAMYQAITLSTSATVSPPNIKT